VGNEENQKQASLVSHRPWKSLRDSHIPTASTTTILSYSLSKTNLRKEPSQVMRPPLPSGSFCDEKMLGTRTGPRRNFLSRIRPEEILMARPENR